MNTTSGLAVSTVDLVEYTNAIERNGYVHIPQIFSQEVISESLEKVRYWHNKMQSGLSDRMPRLNKDQAMVYNLQNKDVFFVRALLENEVIEVSLNNF